MSPGVPPAPTEGHSVRSDRTIDRVEYTMVIQLNVYQSHTVVEPPTKDGYRLGELLRRPYSTRESHTSRG